MCTTYRKETVIFLKKKRLTYTLDDKQNITKYKPWLGDVFSFLYDRIMEKSIFPKKFSGSIKEHHKILQKELIHFQNKNIIEIATGSGDAVKYLNNNNIYTGIDISPGLLNIAAKKFAKSGFKEAEFYIADACNIPFNDDCFDFGICNLSLNFFENIELFISELKRVLKPGAVFYCSVPIKDRLMTTTKIRGNIYHEKQLEKKFQDHNLNYSSLNYRNGTLLYFKAVNE